MLEFVFFHRQTRDRFVALLDASGVPWTLGDEIEGSLVAIPEEVDDRLLAAIEEGYAELMDLDQALTEQAERAGDAHAAAGVVVELRSGRRVYARLPPGLLAKLARVLTAEELDTLVAAVVEAVEAPDARPLCAPD
jgi:hypothetical protein